MRRFRVRVNRLLGLRGPVAVRRVDRLVEDFGAGFAAETHSTIESSDASGGDVSDDNFRTYCHEWVIHVPRAPRMDSYAVFVTVSSARWPEKNGTIDNEGSGVRHDNGAVTQFSYTIRFGSRYAFITVRPRWIPSGSWIPQGRARRRYVRRAYAG